MKTRVERLKSIVTEAGEILKEGFKSPKRVYHKGVVDLVTEYDLMIEKHLIYRLKKTFLGYEIVAEESYKNSDYNFNKAIIIDPIDGTTNFVHSIPHIAISVAVWEDNKPVMGVVYNPILNEMFWAVANEGAYLNDTQIYSSYNKELQNALIATGFPYSKVKRGSEYHWVINTLGKLLPNIQDIRRLGSAALDICYVAEGKFDGFYEIGLKPWDTAAAMLVLLEAGGKITSPDGTPYMPTDPIIVASNGYIHQQLLGYMYNS